jgi:transcriptional regulator with XRE-family HTH domain
MLEPKYTPDELRDMITRYRIEHNLSLLRLSREIGVTDAFLSRFERGMTWPTRTSLLKLQIFLDKKKAEAA